MRMSGHEMFEEPENREGPSQRAFRSPRRNIRRNPKLPGRPVCLKAEAFISLSCPPGHLRHVVDIRDPYRGTGEETARDNVSGEGFMVEGACIANQVGTGPSGPKVLLSAGLAP